MNFDNYRDKAVEFRHMVEIGQEYKAPMNALHDHFNVADEEWRELCEAEIEVEQHLNGDSDIYADVPDEAMEALAEEMADVLVTVHVMADMLNIDVKEAYNRKMEYNLQKSAQKNDDGKVTDDVDIQKPDFNPAIHDEP